MPFSLVHNVIKDMGGIKAPTACVQLATGRIERKILKSKLVVIFSDWYLFEEKMGEKIVQANPLEQFTLLGNRVSLVETNSHMRIHSSKLLIEFNYWIFGSRQARTTLYKF